MALEHLIYDRLNDDTITAVVADRIYPTDPAENTGWPFLVYTVTDTSPVTSMTGSTSLSLYVVQLDLWTRSQQQSTTLADAVRARLHCYHDATVKRAALTDQSNEKLGDETAGDIYHTTQTYQVWAAA